MVWKKKHKWYNKKNRKKEKKMKIVSLHATGDGVSKKLLVVKHAGHK